MAVQEPCALTHRPAITHLHLIDFRNYQEIKLDLSGGIVTLLGPNGAGKTNLLEALSLLVPGRGLRNAEFDALPRFDGGGAWAIHARLEVNGTGHALATGRGLDDPKSGRRLRIDGEKASFERLGRLLCMVGFTPSMDGLFSGPARVRRLFLDRLCQTLAPDHLQKVADHDRLVRSRNRLLAQQRCDATWLGALEGRIARVAVAIARNRLDLVTKLNAAIQSCDWQSRLFPAARLQALGNVEHWVAKGPAEAEEVYRHVLTEQREEDRAAGRTLVGVHRCDLRASDLGTGLAAACDSTGRQKALLMTILMAQTRLILDERNALPILLLDEVAAHLDALRRATLLEHLLTLGAQVWLSATDAALFGGLGERDQKFAVANGTVTALNERDHYD